jgi:hypothetical protein
MAVHSREFASIVLFRGGRFSENLPPAVNGLLSDVAYAPKELPQPQVCFAFGLLNTKPFVRSAVS